LDGNWNIALLGRGAAFGFASFARSGGAAAPTTRLVLFVTGVLAALGSLTLLGLLRLRNLIVVLTLTAVTTPAVTARVVPAAIVTTVAVAITAAVVPTLVTLAAAALVAVVVAALVLVVVLLFGTVIVAVIALGIVSLVSVRDFCLARVLIVVVVVGTVHQRMALVQPLHGALRVVGVLRQDDAKVMFGVLQVILAQHPIALNRRVAGHGLILFHHLMRIATDTQARTIAVKGVVMVAAGTTSTALVDLTSATRTPFSVRAWLHDSVDTMLLAIWVAAGAGEPCGTHHSTRYGLPVSAGRPKARKHNLGLSASSLGWWRVRRRVLRGSDRVFPHPGASAPCLAQPYAA
jgi:hypothetical protein